MNMHSNNNSECLVDGNDINVINPVTNLNTKIRFVKLEEKLQSIRYRMLNTQELKDQLNGEILDLLDEARTQRPAYERKHMRKEAEKDAECLQLLANLNFYYKSYVIAQEQEKDAAKALDFVELSYRTICSLLEKDVIVKECLIADPLVKKAFCF